MEMSASPPSRPRRVTPCRRTSHGQSRSTPAGEVSGRLIKSAPLNLVSIRAACLPTGVVKLHRRRLGSPRFFSLPVARPLAPGGTPVLSDTLKQPHDHDVGEVPDPDCRQAEHSRPAKGTAAQQIHGQGQSSGPEPYSDHDCYCMKHDSVLLPAFFTPELLVPSSSPCMCDLAGQEGWTPDCGAVIAGSRKFLSFRFPVISMATPPAGCAANVCRNTR